ncbi:hypothetical protein HYH03_005356 [Edaphochlamys debaryana]|uniref:cyclin-dependent kinase n=1 Tax=Edaphochlamys debaryana TaxID=47281 RepID=A0A835Y529_9CHLO|nr:hypothetical protein HYH03_005356 [Edaphochlamys debaryana]|eukprot:KAG2496532.1 hypothetical protein HYH03_005356 [Edaphochlamys debaryana]
MVFEFVGPSLHDQLDLQPTGLAPAATKLLAWQLLSGVAYLHDKKVLHRDIKPANVLLDPATGVAKLCDFGFARPTKCGPQVLVSDHYGACADVWSLGCTIAEMATGRALFPGTSTADQLWRIVTCLGPLAPLQAARALASPRLSALATSPPPLRKTLRQRLSELEPRLFELVEACLRLDPRHRPTARELLDMPYFWDVRRAAVGTPAVAALIERHEAACSPMPLQQHQMKGLPREALLPQSSTSAAVTEPPPPTTPAPPLPQPFQRPSDQPEVGLGPTSFESAVVPNSVVGIPIPSQGCISAAALPVAVTRQVSAVAHSHLGTGDAAALSHSLPTHSHHSGHLASSLPAIPTSVMSTSWRPGSLATVSISSVAQGLLSARLRHMGSNTSLGVEPWSEASTPMGAPPLPAGCVGPMPHVRPETTGNQQGSGPQRGQGPPQPLHVWPQPPPQQPLHHSPGGPGMRRSASAADVVGGGPGVASVLSVSSRVLPGRHGHSQPVIMAAAGLCGEVSAAVWPAEAHAAASGVPTPVLYTPFQVQALREQLSERRSSMGLLDPAHVVREEDESEAQEDAILLASAAARKARGSGLDAPKSAVDESNGGFARAPLPQTRSARRAMPSLASLIGSPLELTARLSARRASACSNSGQHWVAMPKASTAGVASCTGIGKDVTAGLDSEVVASSSPAAAAAPGKGADTSARGKRASGAGGGVAYEYEASVGEGAYGAVWRCRERATGRVVAVKAFKQAHEDQEILRLAKREAKVLEALRHPNLVKLLTAFRSQTGRVYMVFEFVGPSLHDQLDLQPTGLAPAATKLLAWQLLSGVAYLHDKKVLHRDIKPANVLLDPATGVAKLCDFGFARPTKCGPQILVSDHYGACADVWSLGCTIAEMATGRALFPGTSSADQLWRIVTCLGPLAPLQAARALASPRLSALATSPPPLRKTLRQRLPELEPRLFELVEACLRLDPRHRPTVRELLAMPYFWDVHRAAVGTPAVAALIERHEAGARLSSSPPKALPLVKLLPQRAAASPAASEPPPPLPPFTPPPPSPQPLDLQAALPGASPEPASATFSGSGSGLSSQAAPPPHGPTAGHISSVDRSPRAAACSEPSAAPLLLPFVAQHSLELLGGTASAPCHPHSSDGSYVPGGYLQDLLSTGGFAGAMQSSAFATLSVSSMAQKLSAAYLRHMGSNTSLGVEPWPEASTPMGAPPLPAGYAGLPPHVRPLLVSQFAPSSASSGQLPPQLPNWQQQVLLQSLPHAPGCQQGMRRSASAVDVAEGGLQLGAAHAFGAHALGYAPAPSSAGSLLPRRGRASHLVLLATAGAALGGEAGMATAASASAAELEVAAAAAAASSGPRPSSAPYASSLYVQALREQLSERRSSMGLLDPAHVVREEDESEAQEDAILLASAAARKARGACMASKDVTYMDKDGSAATAPPPAKARSASRRGVPSAASLICTPLSSRVSLRWASAGSGSTQFLGTTPLATSAGAATSTHEDMGAGPAGPEGAALTSAAASGKGADSSSKGKRAGGVGHGEVSGAAEGPESHGQQGLDGALARRRSGSLGKALKALLQRGIEKLRR